MHTGLVHTLDFDRDGKTLAHLSIPFSIDRSPYFQVKVPICLIRNGEGPSLLLMAGNHGDEYEGELSLAKLVRRLDPKRIRGRVTILPMANAPAVMAAKRCSPLDGGNLNRAFPGDPSGTPTSRLANFLETKLFSRHDVVFDIHSGGTSMEHLPTALVERNAEPERHRRGFDLMRTLGMPYGFIADNGTASPTSMGAARRAGAVGVSGEFGGGGTATVDSMALTARALDRLMVALGVVEAPVLAPDAKAAAPTRLLSLSRHSQGIYATRRGWFEPAVRLGDSVSAGQLAGWYHDLERLDVDEEALHFAESGIVLSRRLHTMCEAGDCLMQVAEPVEG
ncbi:MULTISPECIES: succinylglutamate desuccinylase/aspartoacylase family protein [unclassified Mesorhizobium]|uniref:succinylglutamate desuccinylase/aspartoacylase family protein n=1 Tax=unclassified Mesorhizobium TaxID=325217 RepID=UPI000FCCA32E|nr:MULTISPECIES: succinylglutamate desuccinylase/aspartoacylase family protein [unclassified Mesorhizobium]RUW66253.1 deacylase [Mesorhizobium sp. M4B.F.Ca.ET.049.02.1.2]TGV26841.1 deacylase [Mesorhizobium sp. M4B.F.Ca.ET.143.01.1.1]